MELSLKGRNALITGAGAGIGLACARVFVAAGANVAICDVEQARLDDALSLLTEIGGNHYGQLCDVANAEAVADFFRNSQSALGSLDITLNNAGVGSPLVPLAETDEADYDRLMGINLKGVWLCMRESLKIMSPAGSGHIINMASALSKTTFPGAGLYVASKHAVGGLTRNTAVEYGESGIRINAICPRLYRDTSAKGVHSGGRSRAPRQPSPHESTRHPGRRRQSGTVVGERCFQLRNGYAVLC